MSFERLNIQLAIKLDAQGKLPPIFYKKLNEVYNPTQLNVIANMTLIEVIKAMIRRFKDYSEKIGGIEETTTSKRHQCDHDINPHGSCVEEDI